MSRLEYRLYAEGSETYPLLYYYDRIGKDEVLLRFACDYFIKDGRVYEKTSCAVEASCYVIYVQEAEDERVMPLWGTPKGFSRRAITMELREYQEGTADYPLIRTFSFPDPQEALLHLQANYLMVGDTEWCRTSAEIDEDRETYVFYAVPNH
ncbi:hypothetical protein [Paenibacillus cremeus]|uniref:Uncharacterized protein n=1 Tax=Paenibacillus cremeus TaxID=2163881 RepID=A0A559K9G9_9BACL|nr:hypothetical protein [Paenibacillus cremeus]TVY08762.1 hypothetical protein FPZ49_17065 [Paenibacillus cremeus]